MWRWQQLYKPLKQTFLETTPSSTVGCAPSIHPVKSVPHLWASGMHCVAMLVPAPAENLYQSSVKFLSHFLPRPKSLRRSESFRILYWLHSETAKIKNVSEYSSMWLYQWRNVLISHKRWRKLGHGHQNIFFFGGGGDFKKNWFTFQIQSRSKPCANDVLRYVNIKGPSKHSCTWWYQDC